MILLGSVLALAAWKCAGLREAVAQCGGAQCVAWKSKLAESVAEESPPRRRTTDGKSIEPWVAKMSSSLLTTDAEMSKTGLPIPFPCENFLVGSERCSWDIPVEYQEGRAYKAYCRSFSYREDNLDIPCTWSAVEYRCKAWSFLPGPANTCDNKDLIIESIMDLFPSRTTILSWFEGSRFESWFNRYSELNIFKSAIESHKGAFLEAQKFAKLCIDRNIPVAWHAATVGGFFWALLATELAEYMDHLLGLGILGTQRTQTQAAFGGFDFGNRMSQSLLFRAASGVSERRISHPPVFERTKWDTEWLSANPHPYQIAPGESVMYFLHPEVPGGGNGKDIQKEEGRQRFITRQIIEDIFQTAFFEGVDELADWAFQERRGHEEAAELQRRNKSHSTHHISILNMIAMAPGKNDLMYISGPYGKVSSKDSPDRSKKILEKNKVIAFHRDEDDQLRISPPTTRMTETVAFPFFNSDFDRHYWIDQVQKEEIRNQIKATIKRKEGMWVTFRLWMKKKWKQWFG